MKSHGILMSGEMVRAYLDVRKNQTRRTRGLDLINQNPDLWKFDGLSKDGFLFSTLSPSMSISREIEIKPPYGYLGDELWFKETFQLIEPSGSIGDEWIGDTPREVDGRLPKEMPDNLGSWVNLVYRADDPDGASWWRSSMFMPKWARRIVTQVTGVRVERLHSISEEDCLNEGIVFSPMDKHAEYSFIDKKGAHRHFSDPRTAYWALVDSLNPKTLPAQNNHWVWVYNFPYYGGGEVVSNG